MSESSTDEDKQHEPSQKKLDDARKKGEIPRSTDINTAAMYAGFLLGAVAIGETALTGMGTALSKLLAHADSLSSQTFSQGGASLSGSLILTQFRLAGPLFLMPAILVVLVIVIQKGFVFAGAKLKPKLSRISPVSQAKNKFGRSGLFEFLKSFTKLTIYSSILLAYLMAQLPRLMSTLHLETGLMVTELLRLIIALFGLVLLVALALGGIDLMWQRAEHLRKNRMSRKELTDEQKDAEGDPAMKQQRRQKAMDIALNQVMQDVPDADVIIVNPTHYAVALKWDRDSPGAPVCLAKGVDHIAQKIREIALSNGIPIHSDPPTARALYATIEVGAQIRPEQYRAVAAAIRFAERIRKELRS